MIIIFIGIKYVQISYVVVVNAILQRGAELLPGVLDSWPRDAPRIV